MPATLSLSWWGGLKRRWPVLSRAESRTRWFVVFILPWALLLVGFLYLNHRANVTEAKVESSEPYRVLDRLEKIDGEIERFIDKANRQVHERDPK